LYQHQLDPLDQMLFDDAKKFKKIFNQFENLMNQTVTAVCLEGVR
jgi:hypothetical protein